MICRIKILMFASIWPVLCFSQPDLHTDSVNLTDPEIGVSQKHKIDSLRTILQNQPDDRKKVMLLNEVAGLFTHVSYDSVMKYSDLALNIARKIKDWKGAFNAIKNKGFVVQVVQNDWTGALRHYREA